MNIYNAIMKAADHIQSKPMLCELMCPVIPKDEATRTCILGRVGMYIGGYENQCTGGISTRYASAVDKFLGINSMDFFDRAKALGLDLFDKTTFAPALRLYAAKYHAPKLPDSVTAIFTQSIVHTKRQLEVMEAQP